MKKDASPSSTFRQKWTSSLRTGAVCFAVLAATVLFAFLLFRLEDVAAAVSKILHILQPVLYGLAIAYLLNPIMVACQRRLDPWLQKRMANKKRALSLSKAASITAAMLVGLCVLVVLCLLVIPQLSQSILQLVDAAPGYLDGFLAWTEKTLDSQEAWTVTLNALLEEGVVQLEEWLKTSLVGFATDMLSYVTSGIISVVSWVFNLFVGIVVAVYTLNEKKTFVGQCKKLLYALCKPRRANTVIDTVRHGHKIFGGFLYGKIVDSLIVGLITFAALLIMDMPYALLISVLVGVTNIIPFFGPFIGAIPSAFLILLVSPVKGLYFILFIIVL